VVFVLCYMRECECCGSLSSVSGICRTGVATMCVCVLCTTGCCTGVVVALCGKNSSIGDCGEERRWGGV
jgi:hypothetical protein